MKLQCPKCGSRFEMEQAVRELEQSETHDIAAKLGEHWRLVFEYSECFRQKEYGDVPLTTRLRTFKSITELLDTNKFEYRKKWYRTSWHESIKAMTQICNLQKTGFTNNNYLFKMLLSTSDRLSAEGLSAKEEREREHARARAAHSSKDVAHSPGKMDFKGIVQNLTDS